MFEPVHGSAPDIAGKHLANPIAQIWTGAMMLDHLGHRDAARAVVQAIEQVVAEGRTLTRDLGGTAEPCVARDPRARQIDRLSAFSIAGSVR